ncbi:MAG: hypothetical protein ACPGSL_00245 [Vicingaceae bacterium]
MKKYLILFLCCLLYAYNFLAQDIRCEHKVLSLGKLKNNQLKTTITGIKEVDFARIIYGINNSITITPSLNNNFLLEREKHLANFYLMEIPNTGELIVTFGIDLVKVSNYNFPVELQYSINNVIKSIKLPSLLIDSNQININKVTEEEPLADNKKEDAKKTPVNEQKYTIQLFSLNNFSQNRLNYFCNRHHLNMDKIKKKKSGEWMLISYDEFKTEKAAHKIAKELERNNGLKNVIVVKIP